MPVPSSRTIVSLAGPEAADGMLVTRGALRAAAVSQGIGGDPFRVGRTGEPAGAAVVGLGTVVDRVVTVLVDEAVATDLEPDVDPDVDPFVPAVEESADPPEQPASAAHATTAQARATRSVTRERLSRGWRLGLTADGPPGGS